MRRVFTAALAAALGGWAALEWRTARQPGNALEATNRGWRVARREPGRLVVSGFVDLHNPQENREVMLLEPVPDVHLLARGPVGRLDVEVRVRNDDEEFPPRLDGHFSSYVVKPARYGKDRHLVLEVEVSGAAEELEGVHTLWVDLELRTYGFSGVGARHHQVFVPLRAAAPTLEGWRLTDAGAEVLAVGTHLLTPEDDPGEVVARYAAPLARPGDIVALGESPLAVIQARYRDPRDVRIGWFASRACQFLSGEGSLGTGAGLQSLVDQVGAFRVALALGLGAVAKAAGRPGWFYRIAGVQSKLVDDVTGTLPPYDRFIVLGPLDADAVCAAITAKTGLAAVVVDANDLGFVDVIGRSVGVDESLVVGALRSNPAGNADESTPLVLIRPTT